MPASKRLIETIRNSPECVSVSPELSVWQLKIPSLLRCKDVDNIKRQILEIVVNHSENLLLSYSENPDEDGIMGSWKAMSRGLWSVPEDLSICQFHDWLELGNWILYSIAENRDWSFSTGATKAEVLESMKRTGVEFCIDSFHDNDPWTIYVNTDPGP